MRIDPRDLSRRNAYGLLITTIVPRPIAWVSTLSADGVPNLAPFSFFNGVTSDPPTISVSIGPRKGSKKDTLANLEATGECVVNLVEEPMGERMVATSAELPPEVSEWDACGVEAEPSEIVTPPRVKGVPAAMECRVERILEVGSGPSHLVLARVELFHLRDDLVDGKGRLDATRFVPLGRLGGLLYGPVRETTEIRRP